MILGFFGGALLGVGGIQLAIRTWVPPSPADDPYTHVMERKLAAQLARGNPVVLEGSIDESALRWKIAERIESTPGTAVFGSSHSLRIDSEFLGRNMMNFSISGAAVADHLVVTEILAERGIRPRNWVIFLDPWFFDFGADSGVWKERSVEALRIEARLAATLAPPPELIFTDKAEHDAGGARVQRYSVEPLLARLDGWINEVARTTYVAQPGETAGTLLLPDGSFRPPEDQTEVSAGSARALAERQFASNPDRHRYGTYGTQDGNLWKFFEAWVSDCLSTGGDVWIVMSPYHPAIYPKIQANPENQLSEIERRAHERFDGRDRLHLIGAYDPSATGIDESDFYDGDHLLDSGLRKLLAPVLASGADGVSAP